MNLIRWFSTPQTSVKINKRNFVNVQIDGVGVGLANAAAPFLPVFLTLLGATNTQIGLLTTMPAIAGFLFAIPLGRMLQNKKSIVPWFSFARLTVLMSYFFTGLVGFFIPEKYLVNSILLVWAAVTVPQTILNIAFSVVMNAVAGPEGRFELMSRRWSILGTTTAITVFVIGQVLDRIAFPLNYQIAFMGLSLGGVISFYFSSKLDLPENTVKQSTTNVPLKAQIKNYLALIRHEPAFLSFVSRRFVYMSGVTLGIPLFPLYFVRVLNASNSWIATINTAQTAILIIGYFIWVQQSRRHGSRRVLLLATLALSFYPFLTALTDQTWLIAIYAGIAGIFQAGLNLVFFDELMKTVPPEYSATFVSFAQSLEWMAMIFSPLIGTFLADQFGFSAALIISAAVRLLGFGLFLTDKSRKANPVLTVVNVPVGATEEIE